MRAYTKVLLVAALMTTTVCATPVFAQMSYPGTPTDGTGSKDVQKEKVQQESAQLSPEKAKLYNETMQKAIDSNKELRDQLRKAHQEADDIQTAEKFDKKAFLANSAELDQLYGKMRDKSNEAFISVMEKLTQEDRKIIVKARNDRRHRVYQQQMQ